MGCALCASDGQSFYVCVYVHTALTPLNPASQTVRNLTSPNDAAMMHVYVCVRACVRAFKSSAYACVVCVCAAVVRMEAK